MSDQTAIVSSKVLIPFDRREAITVKEAAADTGIAERTLRRWCVEEGIGRRIGKKWFLSRPALAMFLDGDRDALKAHRDFGVRAEHEPVAKYFRRLGLEDLLSPELGAAA